jgi:hypothetical protein
MNASAYRTWRKMRQRVQRLSQVGPREHALLAEASVRLLVAKIAIKSVPFARLAPGMGELISPPQAQAKAAISPASAHDLAVARTIGWAVTRAARHVPFEAVCLPQAMAAHAMLRKRGIFSIIHFGTARAESNPLSAHAWVNVEEVEVTGYPVGPEFTEIACIA